jgi:uncharacterized protein (DUF608 family)
MKSPQPLFPFQHKHILQTALPIGGIGAGCVCLNGHGGLEDFSIRHRPATSALPDSHGVRDAAFAILRIKSSTPVARLVEGPLPTGKIYDQGLQAQGYRHGGHEGLPRFQRNKFESGYPFGRVRLSDPAVPIEVAIIGWNPFIPLDDVASGIPCAILEYTLRNTSRKRVQFEFSYHLSHLAAADEKKSRNQVIPGKGIHFHNAEPSHTEQFGSASLTVIGQRPAIKAMWLRGGWFDAISAIWREAESGKFTANNGKADSGKGGRNGGSILVKGSLAPGKEMTLPVVITWHFPNSNQSYGATEACCPPGEDCTVPLWKPFYASQWKDAKAVADHVHRNYLTLRSRTVAFQNALLSSTLPVEAMDAISANLAILKSPTVLRQENGNLWAWEGCFTGAGCCHGSCTHVWNYAQAIPHLFPKLERTLRAQELQRSMDKKGYINFRAALPDGPPAKWGVNHAAADGQLGGIMKVYRDWQISGDTAWLRELYPLVKRSLDYCIATWDPERKGALLEPHHNTYDIEFWGADGMCTSIYIGALNAMALMAHALERAADEKSYSELAERGVRYMDKKLFNGEYYEQKVQYRGLKDTSFADLISGPLPANESRELVQLLKKEGPRYQYGKGCLSDGVIGAWMAEIYGIATPLKRENIRKNLRAIYRHNFKRDLSAHANCQRPGYAMGREAGLLLCSWPKGGKPTLPFVYSDEVWTGIEYQVASHLIAEGYVREGTEIVAAVRRRYDGEVRNPWNEYECGSYYARAMASYALLAAYSGFRYSAVTQTLHLGPKTATRPFTIFFSTASGFGSVTLDKSSLTIEVLEGRLELKHILLTLGGRTAEIACKKVIRPKSIARLRLPSAVAQ